MASPVITHRKVSSGTVNPSVEVDLSNWNDTHVVTGLENVDNTSDVNKPVSTAQAAAIAAGVASVTKASLGLGNVDNTSDANKPVSTAQAAALALKAPLASPAFTGTPTAPTAAALTSTTQVATTAFVTGATREKLTANRTYYVLTTGSDSNTGLVNNSGGAFLTIQKAIDVVASLDLSIFNAIIQVGNGTYTQPLTLKNFVGAGTATLQGDTVTPSNVVLSATSNNCITADLLTTAWTVTGFKMQTTTGGQCITANTNSVLVIGTVEYGACAGYHLYVNAGSNVKHSTNFSISGGAAFHLSCENSSVITYNGAITVTLSGTPAFSSAFAHASRGSGVIWFGATFVGGASAGTKKYLVESLAYIDTNGGGAGYFPGGVAGTGNGVNGALYV